MLARVRTRSRNHQLGSRANSRADWNVNAFTRLACPPRLPAPWPVCGRQGVLVKTGVYKEGDETNGAAVVVQGIGQAVDWILEQEAKMA